MVHLVVTALIVLSGEFCRSETTRTSGPFKIEVEKMTKCEDEGSGQVVVGTKIMRSSAGVHVYNDTIYFGRPIDEDTNVKLELQSFSNGGYRPRYMHHTFKGCVENWKYFSDFFLKLRTPGVTIEGCPISVGNYTTVRLTSNSTSVTNMPSMVYNKYRGVFTTYYRRKKTGCVVVYADVVPK